MQITTVEKNDMLAKRTLLQAASVQLHIEFIGISDQINELVHSIEPWFLFPNAQTTPTIINLWGMTGVGKTSLINRLFDLINQREVLYTTNVGEIASTKNFAYFVNDTMEDLEKRPIGLLFDEFQLGRTIDDDGKEIKEYGLNLLWQLIDSGKFEYIPADYSIGIIQSYIGDLRDCLDNGVIIENGVVVAGFEYWDSVMTDDISSQSHINNRVANLINDDDGDVDEGEDEDEESAPPSAIVHSTGAPVSSYNTMFCKFRHFKWLLSSSYCRSSEVKNVLLSLNGGELLELLEREVLIKSAPVVLDFTKSVIFIVGNLDEVYHMSGDVNPDISADQYYEHSKTITLAQVKDALHCRFRSEQIARLGNDHIIYTAFTTQNYIDLITLHLNLFKSNVMERFDIDITFDQTVNAMLYSESVFPTQGTRPVISTIKTLIHSYIGKFISDIVDVQSNDCIINVINWRIMSPDRKHALKYYNNNVLVCEREYKFTSKVDILRDSIGDDFQCLVASHEAGHAIAAIFAMHLLPTMIFSRTADGLSEGFTVIPPIKSAMTITTIEARVVMLLSGVVAQKLLFGDESHDGGCARDLEQATAALSVAYKKHGMRQGTLGVLTRAITENYESVNDDIRIDELIKDQLQRAESRAKSILTDQWQLLLKMTEYLSNNSVMSSELINDYVELYGEYHDQDTSTLYRDPENYYNYRETMNNLLINMDNV